MKKSAGQTSKNIYHGEPATAGAANNSEIIVPVTDEDLAQLVWKYFREEITQAIAEAQQGLAQERVFTKK